MPVIEAQMAGCPVIASNISSLPEVAGEAALLVDPFSVTDIAAAMQNLAIDEGLRAYLIEKGFRNATRFSWEHTAGLVWQSLEKAMQQT
jgi:glycosyltransferase involved in cell wall biosynthesis